MNSTIFKNNIAELEARINTLESKNSELKTSNQLLSKKAEWLETELVMSKHYCALLKNSIYGKRSEKSKTSHAEQRSSSPRLAPQALTEPYVTVSRHTALLFDKLILCQ